MKPSFMIGLIFLYQAKAASLWYYETKDYHTVTPLTSPLGLLNSSFNVSLTTVIYTFGFNGKVNGSETTSMVEAYSEYKENNPINFILLDWEKEASKEFQTPTSGVLNAKKIGLHLGGALKELSEHGLNLNDVHLIGHSLGAHLMGAAGKRTQIQGSPIRRITGLDPAKLTYIAPKMIGLRRTDANFVDVLHTNPWELGTILNIGHVNIWPNCENENQPGCSESDDSCKHIRSALYFAESVKYPSSFPAVSANSCHDWANGNYNKSDIIYMGIPYNSQARGIFYMKTNSKSPFGKGMKGIYSNNIQFD